MASHSFAMNSPQHSRNILPIPWPSLHHRWSHPVQRLHSHITLASIAHLTALHSAHQGVTSTTARAKSTIFWPGITPVIASIRANCGHCNRMATSQPSAPPYPPVPPTYPFQCICADFFNLKGMYYLVVVDQYSNWPVIERAHEGSKGLTDSLQRLFATFGIPDE